MNYKDLLINTRDMSFPRSEEDLLKRRRVRLKNRERKMAGAIAANERRRHNQGVLTGEVFILACIIMAAIAVLLSWWIGGTLFPVRGTYMF
jgi:hypothetical protein